MFQIARTYFKIAGCMSAVYTGGIITTTVRDPKKLEFVKKYPLLSIGCGLLGVSAAGICFPYSILSFEKQMYLLGGFPFNGLTTKKNGEEVDFIYYENDHLIAVMKKPELIIIEKDRDRVLYNFVNDYDKVFLEVKDH